MRLLSILLCASATGAAFGFAAAQATAEETLAGIAQGLGSLAAWGPVGAAATEFRILPGWRTPEGARVAAIEISMAPGWHTYWRAPGDAGIPPLFDWSGSKNLASVSYEWPRPKMFETSGMQTLGYEGRLVLPVRLKPADATAPIVARIDASFGVCDDICIPARGDATMVLAPDTPDAGRSEIEAALALRPRSATDAGVVRATCGLRQVASGNEITATVTFATPADPNQFAVIEPGRPDLWVGMPVSQTEGAILTAKAPIEALTASDGQVLARGDVRLTVLRPDDAVDIRGCEAPG